MDWWLVAGIGSMSLVDNATKLSVEIGKEVETLNGVKRKLKEQLCRLQVEEKAIRELLVCQNAATFQSVGEIQEVEISRDSSRKKSSKRQLPTDLAEDLSSFEEDVNKQPLNLDVRSVQIVESSSSSKEELESLSVGSQEENNIDSPNDQ